MTFHKAQGQIKSNELKNRDFFEKNLYFSSHLICPSLDLREGHVVPWIMSLPLQGTPQDSKVLGKRSEYPKHIIVSSERLFPGDFPLGDPLFMISGGASKSTISSYVSDKGKILFNNLCNNYLQNISPAAAVRRWKKSGF